MAQTVVNKSQAVKDKDGYAGYTFRLEVIMNSYNSSASTYNVTINHYAKGDNATNHKYNGLTTPKSVIKGVAGSTTYGNVTTTVGQITGSEVKVATWTGDIVANGDGNLNITYSASYNANKSSGYLPATHTISETVNMPTIPRYATITKFEVNKRDETSLTVNWAADVSCNAVQYRIRQSGGSFGNWTNTSGTTFNITGLTANTTYVAQIQVRRTDSGLWTQSSDSTGRQTTYDYPTVTSTPNFVIGNPNTITFSNPLGRSCAIYIINPLGTEKGGDTTTQTSITGYNNASWQTFFYNGIPNNQEGTYRVRLVCSEISRDTTVDGGTYSVNINDNRPDFTSFVSQYTADLTSLTHNNQTVIKGQSTITYQITTGATAKNGASITKYTVAWTGATPQTITNIANSVMLTKGTGSSLTITAYDSRNIPNTKTIPFSDFVDYFAPKEIVVNTHRKNGVEETVYGDITGKIYYDTLGTNGEHNTLSTITYSVENGGTNMDYDISTVTYSEQDLTKHEQVFTIQNVTLKENTGVTSFDTNTAYTVSFKITDTTGKYTIITGEIKSGKFALVKMQDENGDYHVGVNGLAEDDCALRVHGKIKSESTFNSSTEINEDYKMNVLKTKNLCNGINQSIWLNQAVTGSGVASGDSGLCIGVTGGSYAVSTTDTQTRFRVGCTNADASVGNQTVYNGVNHDGTDTPIFINTAGHKYLVVNATNLSKIQIEKIDNLLNYNSTIINASFSSTDSLSPINNDVKSIYIPCKANTTYTISKANATSRFRAGTTSVTPASDVSVSDVITSDTGTTITITTSSSAEYLIIYYWRVQDDTDIVLNSLTVVEGTEPPSPTSYEPFVKHGILVDNETYTETVKMGLTVDNRSRVNILYSRNLFDANVVSGRWNANAGQTISTNTLAGYRSSKGIPIKPSTTYTLSAVFVSGAVWLVETDSNGTVLAIDGNYGFMRFGYTPNVRSSKTITTHINAKYLYWYCAGGELTVQPDFMVELGSTMTKYEPYVVPSINIDGDDYKLDSHPIGDVVIRWDETSPASLFGGTWELTATDRFIIGAGNTYALNSTGGSSTISLAHYHRPSSMYAMIGSPYGNANALGFSAQGWHGDDSTYSVGGNTAYATGHPGRSHDTSLGGTTDTRLGSTDITPPYIAFYIWKRIG